MFKLNIISFLLLIFSSQNFFAQEKKIEIISASSLDKDESLYPDANILRGSNSKQVHLRHDNMDIYSNNAIFFQKKNKFIAMGDVFLKQGDSLKLNCDSLELLPSSLEREANLGLSIHDLSIDIFDM